MKKIILIENKGKTKMKEENLKPCKPGETHNPNGRPKGKKNTKTILKKYLNATIKHKNPLTRQDEELTAEEHIILSAIAKAISGNDRAREDILNRLYGKPTEHKKIKHSGKMVDLNNYTLEELDSKLKEYEDVIKKADE